MKNKTGIWNGILILLIVCMCGGVQLWQYLKQPPSSTKVFQDALQYVVEIKSTDAKKGEAFGSGVVWNEDGVIVTNAHVVTFTKEKDIHAFEMIEIRYASQEEYIPVTLIDYDINLDIAFLQMEGVEDTVSCAQQPEKDNLQSGDTVYAIGNTSNYGISFSQGYVGVPLVRIEYENRIRNVIQCDLNISEGNSGGALLNARGEFLGLTTFRTRDTSGNINYGISYSIPVSELNDLWVKIKK